LGRLSSNFSIAARLAGTYGHRFFLSPGLAPGGGSMMATDAVQRPGGMHYEVTYGVADEVH
jgi:hypothetical protein